VENHGPKNRKRKNTKKNLAVSDNGAETPSNVNPSDSVPEVPVVVTKHPKLVAQ